MTKPCCVQGCENERASGAYCHLHWREYMKRRSEKKREAGGPTDNQLYARRVRWECFKHYCKGQPACQCCGITDYEFLTIDHINGGGIEHRKVVPADKLPKWLKANGWPDGYRILCFNCNNCYGLYGFCVHQLERGEDVTEQVKPQFRYLLLDRQVGLA